MTACSVVVDQIETADQAPITRLVPDWANEIELRTQGRTLIAGVDEAGRGAWAGPLVAGAVVLPHPDALASTERGVELAAELGRLRDSKMLAPCTREELLAIVRAAAIAVGVGAVSSSLVDVIGVGPANRLAMARAVRDLGVWPDFLLVDAFKLPSLPIPQRPIIKGDATCISIAAASVVAKVARDRIMQAVDAECPGYDFARHKGYGTRAHVDRILSRGVSPLHRRSYAPIKAILAGLPWPPPDAGAEEEGGLACP